MKAVSNENKLILASCIGDHAALESACVSSLFVIYGAFTRHTFVNACVALCVGVCLCVGAFVCVCRCVCCTSMLNARERNINVGVILMYGTVLIS